MKKPELFNDAKDFVGWYTFLTRNLHGAKIASTISVLNCGRFNVSKIFSYFGSLFQGIYCYSPWLLRPV